MDKLEQERIESLGFCGILMESFIIILSWRKLFTQITMATIFPLSLIFLAHVQFSEFLFPYNTEEIIAFRLILKIAYFVFFLTLSLLSTSAVIHAVECFYAKKEITFVELMSVVPKVWKRLTVTFIWSFILLFVYNIAAFSILFPNINLGRFNIVIWGALLLIYMMGFVYISIIWHLACVVSVLEDDCCGIEAMMKSKAIVKGKMVISFIVFLFMNSCFVSIQVALQRLGESYWSRISCFLLLSGFTLLGLVVQSVVYFVCKLCHCDNIYLPNHPDVYLGDYAILGSKDAQLEQC